MLMAHEIAKLILEQAEDDSDRIVAVRTALDMKMPIHEIEEYLDWLDLVRLRRTRSNGQDTNGRDPNGRDSNRR